MSSRPFWKAEQLADVLQVKASEAPGIVAALEMLGYVEAAPGKRDAWRNTTAGNTVSGTKPARFKYEKVVEALDQLRARTGEMNGNASAPFQATDLVAFGDFLDKPVKCQAADVGVALTPHEARESTVNTAVEHSREEHILTDLRAKSAMLHLRLLEDWMRKRSHLDLRPDKK